MPSINKEGRYLSVYNVLISYLLNEIFKAANKLNVARKLFRASEKCDVIDNTIKTLIFLPIFILLKALILEFSASFSTFSLFYQAFLKTLLKNILVK